MRREKPDISSETPIEFYNRHATMFGERYTSVRFEDVQRGVLAHLPVPGSRILDVGAGSGRDTFALAERGYIVTAVEPAVLLQRWARSRPVSGSVEWVEDRLPDLLKLRTLRLRFDFILCSAVLMHLPATQLRRSMSSFRELLVIGGTLAISVRGKRPSDPIDVFYDLSDVEIMEAATSEGFSLIESDSHKDSLGRKEIRWRSFVFRRI